MVTEIDWGETLAMRFIRLPRWRRVLRFPKLWLSDYQILRSHFNRRYSLWYGFLLSKGLLNR